MSKRISDVERITTYFQTADESACGVMAQVIKGIMAERFKTQKKTRGPNKLKAVDAPKDNALAAGQ